jgi:hypothetical protein
MGHSDASLYRNTSMGCPLTDGSLGRTNSLGVMSAWELYLEAVVKEASVLARVLKIGGFVGGDPCGEACSEACCVKEEVGYDEAAAMYDCDLEFMGTVRFLEVLSNACRSVEDSDLP